MRKKEITHKIKPPNQTKTKDIQNKEDQQKKGKENLHKERNQSPNQDNDKNNQTSLETSLT